MSLLLSSLIHTGKKESRGLYTKTKLFASCFDVPSAEVIMAKSDSELAQEEAKKSAELFSDLGVFCSYSTSMVILSCCLLNTLTKL